MKQAAITIVKNDHLGEEVWRYQGQVLAETPNGILVEARFNRADLVFNGILLKENDRFVECYSRQKWFNIYEIYDRDDALLKAWYCNVTRPAHWGDGILSYDDLALDLLVYPSGQQLTLDEDEFMRLNLPESEQKQARQALEELKGLFILTAYPDLRALL
jgi:hypothetical protein